MEPRSPADWVEIAAEADPDAPALVFAEGPVTYGQLADQVHRRAGSIGEEWSGGADGGGSIVPIPVRLDLPSIVEVLALQSVGLVPAPFVEPFGRAFHGEVADATLVVATSGTSGVRRLVPLTMANLAASVAASRQRLGTDQGDRWLLCLPIDHIGGLSVLWRSFEAGGVAVVGPFGQELVGLIRRMRPTVASLVPTMVHRLLTWDPEALAAIDLVLVGGGRLPPSVAMLALDAGVPMVTTYGSTETASQVATMRPGESWRHPGFVGAPLEGFTVTIEDADASGAGTVTMDGPAVFSGYAGEPAREGPFRSSDIGRLADDGTLTVLGRADDVVVTGGLNVSLTEVGDVVASIEGIDEVAVVGVDDDEWGTAVCAMVSTDLPLGRVRDAAGRTLLPHQVPRRWVSSSIPLLPNGKPDKARIEMAFRKR